MVGTLVDSGENDSFCLSKNEMELDTKKEKVFLRLFQRMMNLVSTSWYSSYNVVAVYLMKRYR